MYYNNYNIHNNTTDNQFNIIASTILTIQLPIIYIYLLWPSFVENNNIITTDNTTAVLLHSYDNIEEGNNIIIIQYVTSYIIVVVVH